MPCPRNMMDLSEVDGKGGGYFCFDGIFIRGRVRPGRAVAALPVTVGSQQKLATVLFNHPTAGTITCAPTRPPFARRVSMADETPPSSAAKAA